MRRREYLLTGVATVAGLIAGCRGPTGPSFDEGFEAGFGTWESGAAIGPEVDLAAFDWEVGVSDQEAASGSRSLRIWNEGDYDDGVTWATHPVTVESGQAYQATVTAQLWSESESFNTLRDVVMRLGPEPPERESDFPHPGVNTTELGETPYGGLREPLWLSDGWREYTFEWTTPVLPSEELHIAIGTSVIWEGDATHYVDDITVELEAR